jgi:AcrR family transcriptional regulator
VRPTKLSHSLRRKPSQARAQRTVEAILEGAARVFRERGFGATTNHIAIKAGVSVGTLYEYFPHKQALLVALAERHLESAERGIGLALTAEHSDTATLLASLQQAIVTSQRYPSQAIALVHEGALAASLRTRAAALRAQVLAALTERARRAGHAEPELRASAVFAVVAELSSQVAHELATSTRPSEAPLRHFLQMGIAYLSARMER